MKAKMDMETVDDLVKGYLLGTVDYIHEKDGNLYLCYPNGQIFEINISITEKDNKQQ